MRQTASTALVAFVVLFSCAAAASAVLTRPSLAAPADGSPVFGATGRGDPAPALPDARPELLLGLAEFRGEVRAEVVEAGDLPDLQGDALDRRALHPLQALV